MADPKQKLNENPSDQNKKVPDVLKLGQIKASEIAPQIAAEKTDVKKETTKGTSEIKREVLQMEINPDKDTPLKIDKLDVQKGLETKEQREGFNMLEAVTGTTLLAMIFDQGIKKEALKPFENISSIGGPLLAKLNPAEKISLKKLQEIASKPGSALYAAMKERWDKLVDRGNEIYEGAKKIKENFNSPQQKPAEVPANQEKPKTFWENATKWMGEHKILTAGIAIAGSYGAYRMLKWMFSSKDKNGDEKEESGEKKESWFDKILGNKWVSRLKWTLGIGTGIFVLGRLIGSEDVGKWIKDKLGIDITGNRLSQFVMLLSEFKFIEAFKVLISGPDENLSVHRSMAEKISKEMGTTIKPETLKEIGGIKYDEFMSTIAEGKSAISGILGKIPGLNIFVGSAETAEQEKVLRAYFEKHADEIKRFKNSTTTVDQVLTNLDAESEGKTVLSPEIAAISADIEKLPPTVKPAVLEMQKDMTRVFPAEGIKEVLTNCKKNSIDTKKLETLYAQLKQAIAEWQDAIKKCKSESDLPGIADKAQKIHEINDQVCEEVNNLTNELKYRRGWTEAELLAATQSWKIYRFLSQPKWRKEYSKYLVGKYLKKPIELGKEAVTAVKGGALSSELIGKEFKPNATTAEIEEELKKATSELETAREKQKNLDANVNSAEKISVNDQKLNEKKIELLEKDELIHKTRKSVAEFEDELAKLKAKGSGGDAARIAELEKGIEQDKSLLRKYMNERLVKQGNFLDFKIKEQRLNLEKEFGASGKEVQITKGHFEQMDALADSVLTHRKQIDLQIGERFQAAEALAKEGKPIKEVAKEINELQKIKVKIDLGLVTDADKFTTGWKKSWDLRTAMKGGVVSTEVQDLMKAEKNQIQSTWSKILYGQKEAGGARKLLTNGNLKLYALFVGVGSVINFMDQKDTKDWSNSILQAGVDTLPFVSTASDFYSAASGEEYFTKRKLDAKDRGLRIAFGVGGALCDASELAGVFMSARAGLGVAKEARAVGKSMKLAEAIRASKGEVNSIEALREMSATGHWTMKMAMGGALGLMGYELFLKPAANVELSQETIGVLDNQVQNTNIESPKITPLVTAD